MATYTVTRNLSFHPQPLSHPNRIKLYELLDEWYGSELSMPPGGFTDLCELFQCHPAEARRAIDKWRKSRRNGKRNYRSQHGIHRTDSAADKERWNGVRPMRDFD